MPRAHSRFANPIGDVRQSGAAFSQSVTEAWKAALKGVPGSQRRSECGAFSVPSSKIRWGVAVFASHLMAVQTGNTGNLPEEDMI